MIRLGELRGAAAMLRRALPCGRKSRYPTLERATAAMLALLDSPDCVDPDTLNAYPCRHCRGFHIGHLAELRTWAGSERPDSPAGRG